MKTKLPICQSIPLQHSGLSAVRQFRVTDDEMFDAVGLRSDTTASANCASGPAAGRL